MPPLFLRSIYKTSIYFQMPSIFLRTPPPFHLLPSPCRFLLCSSGSPHLVFSLCLKIDNPSPRGYSVMQIGMCSGKAQWNSWESVFWLLYLGQMDSLYTLTELCSLFWPCTPTYSVCITQRVTHLACDCVSADSVAYIVVWQANMAY